LTDAAPTPNEPADDASGPSSYGGSMPPPPQPPPPPTWVGRPPPATGAGHPDTFTGRIKRALAPLAAVGAFFAKFGAVLIKLKAFTVVGSMAVSVAAYAWLWGWQFGLGFVLLIFVHEMGHVVALRRRGVPAGAPVFLPFIGAYVKMKEMPKNVYVEAETALAGPVTGSIGAFGVLVASHYTGSGMLRDLAFTGFLLNLFNLLPALPLDGGRVAGALHPAVWLVGLLALLVLEFYRPSPVILLILVIGGAELYRRWRNRNSPAAQIYHRLLPGQRARIGIAYVGLAVVLGLAVHATYVPRSF
jgi:Zn-dependent protease